MNTLDIEHTPRSVIEMTVWLKSRVLFLVKAPEFEYISHGGIINTSAKQVQEIMNREQEWLLDPYLPDSYQDYLILDNRIFFTTVPWNALKFIDYLKW